MNTPSTAPFGTEAAFRQAIDTITVAASREIRIFDRDLSCVSIDRKNLAEALEQYFSDDRRRRLRDRDPRSGILLTLLSSCIRSNSAVQSVNRDQTVT